MCTCAHTQVARSHIDRYVDRSAGIEYMLGANSADGLSELDEGGNNPEVRRESATHLYKDRVPDPPRTKKTRLLRAHWGPSERESEVRGGRIRPRPPSWICRTNNRQLLRFSSESQLGQADPGNFSGQSPGQTSGGFSYPLLDPLKMASVRVNRSFLQYIVLFRSLRPCVSLKRRENRPSA